MECAFRTNFFYQKWHQYEQSLCGSFAGNEAGVVYKVRSLRG